LTALVHFLQADARLVQALRAKDWSGFALVYNGDDYKKYSYDTRMKADYEKEKAASVSPSRLIAG